MEAKDVKVGMKVVPHGKTAGPHSLDTALNWKCNCENEKYGEYGFFVVFRKNSDGSFDLQQPNGELNFMFNACDFSPAQIEVGDTVRLGCACHKDTEGIVYTENGGLLIKSPGGTALSVSKNAFPDLVRKAKKPAVDEAKPEPAPKMVIEYKQPSTVRVAMVRHEGQSAKYLFSVPAGASLQPGDKVLCATRRGETIGWINSKVQEVPADLLPFICELTGAYLPLHSIVGKYTETVERFEVPT